jgi:NADH-quinone oxidoreductase subunit F
MGKKILLENIDNADLRVFDTFRALGGYAAVDKALKEMKPEDVLEEVKKSSLRGRGGAGFPTGMKWGFLDRSSGKLPTSYVILTKVSREPSKTGTWPNVTRTS